MSTHSEDRSFSRFFYLLTKGAIGAKRSRPINKIMINKTCKKCRIACHDECTSATCECDTCAEQIRKVMLDAVQGWVAGYAREVRSVKQLGEAVGYGNMMSIASALWAIKLKEEHGIDSGAFIPTIPAFMKKKEAKRAVADRERTIANIKACLNK